MDKSGEVDHKAKNDKEKTNSIKLEMARIMEICGSPGVGKSTIFAEIERRRNARCNWSTASNKNPMGKRSTKEFFEEVFSEIKEGKKVFNPRTGQVENWVTFIKRIYRGIKLGKDFVDLHKLKKAGDHFVAKYPEYVESCWANINYRQAKSINGLDLRFEKTEFIYLIIKKFQFIKEKDTDKYYIIDEGLINMIDRGLFKSSDSNEEREEILNLLQAMPWPDAIVYIQTDLKENARRIITRKDIRDMHRGLDTEELINFTQRGRQRILTAVEHLEVSGTPVLYLDSSRSVQENSEKIIEFASGLVKNDSRATPKKKSLELLKERAL